MVNLNSPDGATIDRLVRVPSAGTYQLAFRYANTGKEGITLPISVGSGGTMKTVHQAQPFPRTGGRRAWEYVSVHVPLPEGQHTVRLEVPANVPLLVDSLLVLPRDTVE